MENRTIKNGSADYGIAKAAAALCLAVERVGGDQMDVDIGYTVHGAELPAAWRVTVARADDAKAPDELCQKHRKMLLKLCGVDSVRDDAPPMLDHLRGHLDNDIELSDSDVHHIGVLIEVLEFLLETEPAPPDMPGTADEVGGVGERVLSGFMKSAHD